GEDQRAEWTGKKPREIEDAHSDERRVHGALRTHREQLLQLGGEHRVAGDAQLALEVELHAERRVLQHALEVRVRDFDRALRVALVALHARRRGGREIDGPRSAVVTGDLEQVHRADLFRLV